MTPDPQERAAAAALWRVEGELRPIALRENAVYAARLPSGPAAIRFHRPGYQSEAAIGAELWWCGALADAGLPVPHPLPAADGRLVVRLDGGRLVSAVAWLDGAPIGNAAAPLGGTRAGQIATHRALGALVARIHAASDALVLPPGFERPRWDREGMLGEAPLWGRFWAHPGLRPAEAARLERLRPFLAETMARAGDVGLIHADLLRENILAGPQGLALIDFDDSGVGHRLYDLGTALAQSWEEPALPDLRAALIEGYARIRPLPDGADEMVAAFTLMRACASVGWLIGRVPPDAPVNARHIARALHLAKAVPGGA
jgi:Ser/Thr protein kinase RdoA (MazF antagonist)